jgi:hypothetical protein
VHFLFSFVQLLQACQRAQALSFLSSKISC